MADDEVNPLGSPTTNYGWTKPAVGGDVDAWGGMLNADLDGIDSVVHGIDVRPGYTLPTASTTVLGGVKVDGSTVTISGGGVISSAAGYTLPTASTTVLGGVKVDGTTVAISGGGVISAAGAVAVSAVAPSSPVVGTLWFDTNGGQMYVWYNDGTSSQWVPVVNQGSSASSSGSLIVPPPVAASWTQRGFGGSTTLTNVTNGVCLFDASTAVVANAWRGATITSPSTPYTIDANFSAMGLLVNNGFFDVGLGWTDGTKLQAGIVQYQGSSTAVAGTQYTVNHYPTLTGGGTSDALFYGLYDTKNLWLRVVDNGTNVTFSVSPDGVTYFITFTIAKSSGALGSSGYSNVGFWMNGGAIGNGSSANMTLCSWYVH